ncbi:MAG: DUF1343 domain-containing protein [Algibacter sp.]|uniref:exo-beta-N-acetylmuramidase NamZ family protein n=1 Tax=Algibacter sp. TaxID=1872428 RepID=UPI0026274461|nr:DUF1343 domain-containing protein [Algibacter sp.]MDG1728812.1 DUF1343 domain-containing protein [Algibacter sp.]MDG2177285.1 DUF1343 domain-containing protein [Algibacter sp.]
MKFNVFKNTVFPIIIGIVLVMISCASKVKNGLNEETEVPNQFENDSSIVVGANQTEMYLPLLKGKRIGIVANQTSVIFKNDNTNTHLVDSLVALNMDVKKVFSPEHGFRGRVDAGEIVKDDIDTKTNLPIVSLYGKNKKPTKEQLEGLDIVVFDIQDIGVRFYTYISTLHYLMEACSENNIPVLILDRPNPNGQYIDGPTMEKQHQSFLGMHPIPLVYGMTIGEYAQMVNGEKWLSNEARCDITIIPCANYTHNKTYSLLIRPSPNIPNDQSIKLYPSLGLFEGTNVNAGRGTEFQFQRYGAPFLNPETMTFTYTPHANFGAKHPKHKSELCYGEDLSNATIKDEMTLKWIIKAYENTTDKSLFFLTDGFTKHAGTNKLQKQIEAGLSEEAIKATWQDDLERFKKTRKTYLIYP